MSNIERYWTLERPTGVPNELISDDAAKRYRTADAYRQGYRVKGPFVRASDYEGAVHRGDWFRQAWANAAGISVEEAERSFQTLGDITAVGGQ
jgi:hypothetical protein